MNQEESHAAVDAADIEDATLPDSQPGRDLNRKRRRGDDLDHDRDDHDDNKGTTTLITPPFEATKWKRLKKHYTDGYVDLFNTTYEGQPASSSQSLTLSTSQIGAVTWSAVEKDVFFTALARLGRHDLEGLSLAIGTKSPVEVKHYLNVVHQAFLDRQIYLRNPRTLPFDGVDAAVEIGRDCEVALNSAAEALSAFQEQFDASVRFQENGSASVPYVITSEVLEHLDRAAIGVRDSETVAEEPDRDPGQEQNQKEGGGGQNEIFGSEFFNLPNWLHLSERLFMNFPPESKFEHWSAIAEDGQRPACTRSMIRNFHRLVVSFVRKVLQVVICAAQARSSRTSWHSRERQNLIRRRDVHTALRVLNMPSNSWHYWIGLPRKNGYTIVSGSHDKGASKEKTLSLEDVEEHLSKISATRSRSMSRSTSRSRSRSRSRSISMRGSASMSTDVSETNSLTESEEAGQDVDLSSTTNDTANYESTSSGVEDEESDASSPPEKDVRLSYVDRDTRRELVEEAQDAYMEALDHKSRLQEEAAIWHILGQPSMSMGDDSDRDIGPRPKTLRHDEQELCGWVCTYMAEWEQFGERLHEDEFSELVERPHKTT